MDNWEVGNIVWCSVSTTTRDDVGKVVWGMRSITYIPLPWDIAWENIWSTGYNSVYDSAWRPVKNTIIGDEDING